MASTVQWTYAQREPISWSMAMLMVLAVVWGFSGWHAQTAPAPLTEMTALLDIPATMPKPEPVTTSAPKPPSVIQPAVLQPAVQSMPATAPVTSTAPLSTAPSETPARVTDSRPSSPAPAVATPVMVTPAPSPAEPTRPAASASYEAQLLAYLERIKRYPTSREARLSQPQGVVKLWLEISRNGSLLAAGLMNSSGSNILDSEALRTVRTAQFPPFPEQAFNHEGAHRFSVSLKYQIEGQ
jgi:protein TonB